MTKAAALHEEWMRESDYREAYDRLGPEFELSLCPIEARTSPEPTPAEPTERIAR